MITEKRAQNLKVGDIVLCLHKDGTTTLALCTAGYIVYDRQGGEGACILHENGRVEQFSYDTMHDPNLAVIANIEPLEANPIRQLLVWRQQFERN